MPNDPLKSDLFQDAARVRGDIRLFLRAKRNGWLDDATDRACRLRIARMLEVEGEYAVDDEVFLKVLQRLCELERVDQGWVKMALDEERAKDTGPSKVVVEVRRGEHSNDAQ